VRLLCPSWTQKSGQSSREVSLQEKRSERSFPWIDIGTVVFIDSLSPYSRSYQTQLGNLQATALNLVRLKNQARARPCKGMVMPEQRQANGRASMEMDTRSPQTPTRVVRSCEQKKRLNISACVIAASTEVATTDTEQQAAMAYKTITNMMSQL
ncbi:MAG: hypothetical protein Q9180_006335, partial [Flavoplaca navasiana]